MANLSTAMVRLTIVDEEYEEIPVDFNQPVFKQFREAFAELSYQGGGEYKGDGCFDLAGRWAFSTNLGWKAEIQHAMVALLKALKASKIPYESGWALNGSYADMDMSMDWCGVGEFKIFFDDFSVMHNFDSMTLDKFSIESDIPIPEPKDDEDEEDYDIRWAEWEVKIIEALDAQY